MACVALGGLAVEARAQVVYATYEFAGGSWADSAGHTEVTADDFTPGPFTGGKRAAGSPGVSKSTENAFVRTQTTGATSADGDTLDEAIERGNYWGFTLTNNAGGGGAINLTHFEFDYFATAIGSDTFTAYVMSDVSGFEAGSELGRVGIRTNKGKLENRIDLSSLGPLADGQRIEFRVYLVDRTTNQHQIHRLDRVRVIGEAPAVPEVPEPE